MKRFLIAVVLLVACATPSLAATNYRADAAYGVRYATEKVVELPRDNGKPYLTVIGSNADPRFHVLKEWFEQNETLAAIAGQTHYNPIAIEDPRFSERMADEYPVTPCVVLQDGRTFAKVVEFTDAELPMTADALATGLNRKASAAECFGLRSHRQDAAPAPRKDTKPMPTTPSPKKHSHALFFVILGVLTVVGVLLAVAKKFYDEKSGR